jgi:DNA repair exonuclease SbcCD ATPase subunit
MRRTIVGLLFAAALACAACTNPPDKEMNQARGAIEAARAAGADLYAPTEYKAAVDALKRSEDAVAQRDYRQALNAALDSREQAENAARTAADQKAAVRSQAEKELRDLQATLDEARARLKAAETTRARRRALQAERATIDAADASVQEARTAMGQQDYLGARADMNGVGDRLRAAIGQIARVVEPPAAKRRR